MLFQQLLEWLRTLSPDVVTRGLVVLLTVVVGLFLVRFLAALTQRSIMKKSTPQRRMIARKAITYTGFVVVLMAVLSELGVKLTALLGAAGIVGIAVGFASQTSVSNIISGLFLISEKPFAVGDAIKIGSSSGIIQSIDLLSIKIRTFDNLFIRIPNQLILNSEVTNITRFPIRRMDIVLHVGYREDLGRVQSLLADIASRNPYSLDEPEPLILLNDLKESGVEVLFGLWFSKNDYLFLKNSIIAEIVSRFREEGIEVPYPHRTLSPGGSSDPLAVRIVNDASSPARPAPRRSR